MLYPKFIRRLLSRKLVIWRQLKLQFNPVLHNKYKQIAKECCDAILKFDIDRENRMLQTNNLGVFYKFVNNKLNNRSGIAPLKDAHGNLLMNDDEKAVLLNIYFHSAFTIDNGTLPNFPSRFDNITHTFPPSSNAHPIPKPTISDIQISPAIIKAILQKLKTNSPQVQINFHLSCLTKRHLPYHFHYQFFIELSLTSMNSHLNGKSQL